MTATPDGNRGRLRLARAETWYATLKALLATLLISKHQMKLI